MHLSGRPGNMKRIAYPAQRFADWDPSRREPVILGATVCAHPVPVEEIPFRSFRIEKVGEKLFAWQFLPRLRLC